jgi:hypothetical protein
MFEILLAFGMQYIDEPQRPYLLGLKAYSQCHRGLMAYRLCQALPCSPACGGNYIMVNQSFCRDLGCTAAVPNQDI